MSLLTICQAVADEIGFPAPSAIVNNADRNAKQLLRLTNREGEDLAKANDWQVLKTEATITLVAADQDYALPSDFGWIVPDTTWNRDTDRIVLNPISSREWQYLKGYGSTFGLNLRTRIIGNEVVFEQTISAGEAGESVVYEYISKNWADIAATGTPKASFTIDTDVSRLDEELMTQGVVWRFKKAKGLDWQPDYIEYKKNRSQMIARDGGSKTIQFGGTENVGINIPETGFGS